MTKQKIFRSLIGLALPLVLTGTAYAQATPTTPPDGTMATDPAPATDTMPANPAPSEPMPASADSATPIQQNMAMPATKTYPPCTATLQDSCTNTRREADVSRHHPMRRR